MTDCEICNIVNKDSNLKLYEDDVAVAILNPKPAVPGHILVFSKKHYPIIEQIPDYELAKLSRIANNISSAMFESLGITGTNILINNGISAGQKYPHTVIDIIPRTDNDNLKLEWEPNKAEESELATVELQLKENAGSLGVIEKEESKPIDLDEKPKVIAKEENKEDSPEDNMLIKQLRRIP